jgi:hypothetical protein
MDPHCLIMGIRINPGKAHGATDAVHHKIQPQVFVTL